MRDYYQQKIEDGLIDPPEETPEILAEQQQIWEYIPLVRKIANRLSHQCKLGYLDLCQQGYYILAELTIKIDWLETDRKMISRYVKLSVEGLLKNYCGKYSTVISSPRGADEVEMIRLEDTEELEGSELNPEEALLKKRTRDRVRLAVALVGSMINERESYVLWNCLMPIGEPISYRQVGQQFETSHSSIQRDADRVMAKLRRCLDHENI